MPERIVDRLEPVEIEKENGDLVATRRRRIQAFDEPLLEQLPISEPCEDILVSEFGTPDVVGNVVQAEYESAVGQLAYSAVENSRIGEV